MKVFWQSGERGRETRYQREGTNISHFAGLMKVINDDIITSFNRYAFRASNSNAKSVEKAIQNSVNREIKDLRDFITMNMMGKPSPQRQDTTFNADDFMSGFRLRNTPGLSRKEGPPMPGEVVWKTLSRQARVSKAKAGFQRGKVGPTSPFFIASKALKSYLQANLVKALNSAGGGIDIKVTPNPKYRYKAAKGVLPLGFMTIKMFSKLNASQLPYLGTGDWSDYDPTGSLEARLFRRKDIVEKLAGKPHWHRPMLAPAISFWMSYRIPRAVAAGMRAWEPAGTYQIN